MDYLKELNTPQREAVCHKDGPLLIIAGAGAGKTRTLAYRIYHLIKNGVAPETVCAVTFTNKAASEMRGRITGLLGGERGASFPLTPFSPFSFENQPFVGTFHALGIKILREKGYLIGVPSRFTVKDREGALTLLKDAMTEVGVDRTQFEPRRLQAVISREKGELRSPDSYGSDAPKSALAQVVAPVWAAYDRLLKKERALDFDDLLAKPVALLETHKEAREHFRDRWLYLHIDE